MSPTEGAGMKNYFPPPSGQKAIGLVPISSRNNSQRGAGPMIDKASASSRFKKSTRGVSNDRPGNSAGGLNFNSTGGFGHPGILPTLGLC